MYNFIKTAKYWFSISAALMLASIVVWLIWGLHLGIDFTGGSSLSVQFPNAESRPTVEEMQQPLQELGILDARIQTAGETGMVVKLQSITNEQRQAILDRFADRGISEESFVSVGPALGSELKKKSVTAILLVLLGIIAYISYAFRGISRGPVPSWVFGLGAIIALAHDILLVVGVFIVLGRFLNVQVDILFVTALLTILGFSVHDTIVVYDRIREGLKEYPRKDFRTIVNESINNTLARSLNTSITTLIVLVALYLFGGVSIQYFVLALIIGIITGSYSSIFIASPFLLVGQRLLRRS